MNFDPILEPAVLISLSVLLVTSLIALWARFIPVRAAGKAVSEDNDNPEPPASCPKLSVIVYSYTEYDELSEYLEMAMNQDYPDYEVIVVNEGNAETTAGLTERIGGKYGDRLYITFIPHDAHNLSRRKLAYTVGIKAAKGDIILTTASNCKIPSGRWLSDMMGPFMDDRTVDIVMGYSHADFDEMHGPLKWYRKMDATFTACQWIGAARLGNPYRGDGFNLAYKKDIFFSQKGYAHTIHLINGDDDLFLAPVIDGNNTALAISPDSILTNEWGEVANNILADTKERYLFTSQFLSPIPFVRAAAGSWMQWLSLLAAVAAFLFALPSYSALVIAGIMICLLWITEIIIYARTSRRLESSGCSWLVPLFLLWHPIGNMIFKSRRRSHNRKNYTFA